MTIKEILGQAQQGSDAVTNLPIELSGQNKEVTAAAQKACDLYFADVRLRKKGIHDKVTALEKQKTELDSQVRGMQATVVDAAGTGNADTFAQAQDKLTAIVARKAAISTQINMLQAAHVRGSEELYQAACDAHDALMKANSVYEEALNEIHLVVKEQAKIWSELEEKSEYSSYHARTGHISIKGGRVCDFEKVREHYNKQAEPSNIHGPEASTATARNDDTRNLEINRFQIGQF